MSVGWDGNTSTVLLDGVPKLSVSANAKVFADSFINKPLDSKWDKEGSWTFDGENGLSAPTSSNSKNRLILSGFPLKGTSNYTVEWDMLRLSPYNGHGGCSFYLTEEENGGEEYINICEFIFRYGGIVYSDGTNKRITIAKDETENNTWYKVKVDMFDNQANIYIDGKLIVSQKYPSLTNPIFAFAEGEYRGYNIRNFKLTIND